ncbi:MAG: CoA transferase [Burkholderiales bacterium]|nr:CoA transferase [Burkholderiales bacterium]
MRHVGVVWVKPFEGLRVLDFTQVLSGPFATFQLALLGADVIKVERREGEEMRRSPLSKQWSERGLAPAFQALNGGKRSLTLDLRTPEAIEIVRRLASDADVVVENFRPGVMDKLGIGYAALSALNSRLIYCCISAFGQTGPERLGAGYDGKIQAMSGMMAITGQQETGPTRVGFPVCDVIAGATAAFGLATALYQRERTGKGQLIDVSMLEAALAFLSSQVADYTIAGHRETLLGNYAPSRKPTTNLFRTAEGLLLLAVNSREQFDALMTALGRSDVLADPRFANWYVRKQNEPALRQIIEQVLLTKPAKAWQEILDAAGAPCATIWRVDEIIEHPQIAARGAIQHLDTPYGTLRFAGLGFKLSGVDAALERMAPLLGEHSEEVLSDAGFDPNRIAQLRAAHVI